MNPWTKGMWSAVLAAFGVTIGAQAVEPAVGVPSKDTAWTLKTDDTHLELMVRDNKPFITVLKNPAQGWNWTPTPSEVPLPAQVVVGKAPRPLTWSFREASTASDKNGTILTLRFTSADPALELKSVWRARPGVGPVEHQPTIRNDSTGAVAFADADLVAAQLNLVSDQQVRLFPVAGGKLGYGEGTPLPYQMIQVGTAHGVYMAYDYGCGQFVSTVTNNQIASRWWAAGIRNTATATGETFRCPGIMLQTYRGDEDDGANHFRRWFVIQYYNTFINKGSVLLWQNGGPASQIIKLKGLDRSATYTLTFEDAAEKNCSMTGAQLMDQGVDVSMGPNSSEIIWIN